MLANYWTRSSLFVVLVAGAFAAGTAMGRGHDNGNNNGRSGNGGGGGSSSHSSSSSSGSSSRSHSNSGGGGGNWSGGGTSGSSGKSQSSMSYRSSGGSGSSNNGGSGKSNWSGNNMSARTFARQSDGGSDNSSSNRGNDGGSSKSFKQFSGSGALGNFEASDGPRSYRGGKSDNIGNGSKAPKTDLPKIGRSDSDRVVGSSDDNQVRTFKNKSTGQTSQGVETSFKEKNNGSQDFRRDWNGNNNNNGNQQALWKQLKKSNDDNNGPGNDGPGNNDRGGKNGDWKSRVGDGNIGGRDWKKDKDGSNGPIVIGNGNNNNNGNDVRGRGGKGDLGKWSKNSDKLNDRTAKWFGNSGFGDHRHKGDGPNGNGPNWDGQKWDGHKGDGHKGNNFPNGDQVRNDWKKNWNKHWDDDHDHHHIPFNSGWWVGNNHWALCNRWNGPWHNNNWFWWNWCSAPLLTTWVDFGWNQPCYWDYGPGGYVTYYNDAVYVGGARYATTLDYYAQVYGLAHSVPAFTPDQAAAIEWQPLGVFSITRPNGASNELVQLAVSRDGILSGTSFNQDTGQSRPIQGRVEEATQRAAWCYADVRDSTVMETSLYNLTEPQCTALAHFGPVKYELWQLVRLDQPGVGEPLPPQQ
jgi:hypothetical protein